MNAWLELNLKTWIQIGGIMRSVILLSVCMLLFSLPAGAREIAAVDVPETVVQTNGTTLQLNGAGIRSKFFFKIYIAALYLEKISPDAALVLESDGGKRMAMHFLYDEVGKDDLVEAWNDGFAGNGSPAQLADLSGQIAAFNALFETVKSGDSIILDYIPGAGTSVTIRGENKGSIAGKPFNDLLLSIWLGKEPVSGDLRDNLLGK